MPSKTLSKPIQVFIDLANATARARNAVIANLDLTKQADIGKLAVYLYSVEKYVYSQRPVSEDAQKNRPILFYIVLGHLKPMDPRIIFSNLDFSNNSDLLNILSRVQIWWPGELHMNSLPWADEPCPPRQRQTKTENKAEHTCESPDDLLLLWLIGQSPTYEDVYIISDDKFRSEGEFIGCIAADIDTNVTLDRLANKCGGYSVLPHRLLPTTRREDLEKGVSSVSYKWFAADEAVLHREIRPKESFKEFLQYVIPDEGGGGGARSVWYMSPPQGATTAPRARRAKLDLDDITRSWNQEEIRGTGGRRYYRGELGEGFSIHLQPEPMGKKLNYTRFNSAAGDSKFKQEWASSLPVRDDFPQVLVDNYFVNEMFEMATRCRGGPEQEPEPEPEPELDRDTPDNWESESDEEGKPALNKKKKKKKKKNKSRKKTRKAKRRTKKSKKKTKKKKK